MKVLLVRSWTPLSHAATFSTIEEEGVGATEFQLLLHARALQAMGHEVVVLGVTREPTVQEEVKFEASSDVASAGARIEADHQDAELVLVNTTQHLDLLRSWLPAAMTVQVCQNGPNFAADKFIDLYAFVGEGKFAQYSVEMRGHRHKFVMLPNVVPWEMHYRHVPNQPKEDQILWVGGFGKQGLRRWAKAMVQVMGRRRSLRWILCGPSYYRVPYRKLPEEIADLPLPADRVEVLNLPLPRLAVELSRSLMLLASLGGEDAGVSYLDGHAMAIPVLCGNDIVGKFATPEGTGLRCTTVHECRRAIEWVLDTPQAAAQMGRLGRSFILDRYTEQHQAIALARIVGVHELNKRSMPRAHRVQSDRKFSARFWAERFEMKIASAWRRGGGHP